MQYVILGTKKAQVKILGLAPVSLVTSNDSKRCTTTIIYDIYPSNYEEIIA